MSGPTEPTIVFYACGPGCCAGCQDCYGMGIGCHQEPCRCTEPCTCRWPDEDTDPKWRDGCTQHDHSTDMRRPGVVEDDDPDDFYALSGMLGSLATPCLACGAVGACAYDAEGRALIHPEVPDHGGTMNE